MGKGVISKPREIEMEKLETVAKGQIWLGSQALEIGLVDELGGIYQAITKIKQLLNIPTYKKMKLVDPLGTITIWDILMGSTPENENDFSVPRNSINIISNFVNPITWLRHSGFANFMLLNIVRSPLISSVLMMNNNHHLGAAGNRIFNDLQFMSNELDFFRRNQVLMYSPSLS